MNEATRKTFIRPVEGFGLPSLIEIYRYRELLYLLTLRGVSVIYRQSLLGVAWAIIRPMAMMLTIVIVFGAILDSEASLNAIPYPLFVYSGLVIWNFFASSLTHITDSVVAQANILTKIYFPRMILPLSSLGVAAVDFVIQSILLIALLLYYRISPQPAIMLAPFLFIATGLVALAIGTWLTALNVKFRDVKHLVPFALQLTFYLTPVIYPISFLPESLRWLLSAHPMAVTVQAFRWSTLGTDPPEIAATLCALIIVLVTLISGLVFFRRAEANFADVV
jgi:lipopolysaccharide transport system permease protein